MLNCIMISFQFSEKPKGPMYVPGPDKSKGKINFSTQSPFHNVINALPSKVAPPSTDHSCLH